jgi:hypothetical protein
MNPRVKFALLSTLIGAASFFAVSLALAAIEIAIYGTGPHGYGTFIYIVAPLLFTPVGAVGGLALGVLVKSRSYAHVMAWLGAIFVATLLVLGVFFRLAA